MAKSKFMISSIDPETVSALLRECAEKHIMPYFGTLEDHQKSFKQGNPMNEVTDADHKSETFLTEKLMALLPGSVVVGEEATEKNRDMPRLLENPENVVWVIDPVDGTSNFIRGDTTFCVMVALVADGITQMSWIYDPVNDSMAFAQKGQGAFIDGQRITITPADTLEGGAGYAWYKSVRDVAKDIDVQSLRCSGHEYLRIAKGEALFSVYSIIRPWDHLAGILLVKEAGGVSWQWDRTDLKPGETRGGIITAASRSVFEAVRSRIPDKALQKYGVEP